MAVRVKTKDDFPLDPDAPRLQTALRYAATGSEHRNDMQIFPSSFSTPLGGGPFAEEGIRLTRVAELAQSAGELPLNSNDPHEQMFINCRYLEHPRDRERLREGVRIILDMMEHESFMSQEIANVLNRGFVSIKVDREERPDIDDIYMTALQSFVRRSGGGGTGWPLSMFLTPAT